MEKYVHTKNLLDKVSPSFCLAKWTTVTFHLAGGMTHSCHHPVPHKIPLEEVKKNPAAIHNTSFKINQRKKMIAGERPSECSFCWNIEDLKKNDLSDRIWKSSLDFSLKEFDSIVENPYSEKIKPRYVEISFSNKCQFKCSYCSANFSSAWEEELANFGSYLTSSREKTFNTYIEEENPYVKAFWEWWPQLKVGLDTFRITGGEPLLSPSTFKVLENLIESPEPELTIAVNSNLGAPDVLINKFIHLSNQLMEQKCIKKFEIFASIDAFGKQAEYIRNGLNHDIFWINIEKILSSPANPMITLMCTFNALSITSLIELLKKILEINLKYKNERRPVPIFIDMTHLRHPNYQTLQILPKEYVPEMVKIVEFIEKNHWKNKTGNNPGFHDFELAKARRVLEWMQQEISKKEKQSLQKKFYQFFSEHDRRRNTNFLNAFPEMEKFWLHCQSL